MLTDHSNGRIVDLIVHGLIDDHLGSPGNLDWIFLQPGGGAGDMVGWQVDTAAILDFRSI